MYEPYRKALPVTENVWRRIITLPLYTDMTEDEFARIIKGIRDYQT
jgi:dTDP-4-amino-4,6-dideoxygalactose transaminase